LHQSILTFTAEPPICLRERLYHSKTPGDRQGLRSPRIGATVRLSNPLARNAAPADHADAWLHLIRTFGKWPQMPASDGKIGFTIFCAAMT
jgi:hypothetical protein